MYLIYFGICMVGAFLASISYISIISKDVVSFVLMAYISKMAWDASLSVMSDISNYKNNSSVNF
jgi:hypothetical protein